MTKSKEILSEARNFYKSLYSHRNVNNLADLNSIFEKANAPILTDTIRDNLEGPLSHVELMQALKIVRMLNPQVPMGSVLNFTNSFRLIYRGSSYAHSTLLISRASCQSLRNTALSLCYQKGTNPGSF